MLFDNMMLNTAILYMLLLIWLLYCCTYDGEREVGFILIILLIVCILDPQTQSAQRHFPLDPHTQSAQRHFPKYLEGTIYIREYSSYKKRGILQLLLKSERDLPPIGTFPKIGIRPLPLPYRSRHRIPPTPN